MSVTVKGEYVRWLRRYDWELVCHADVPCGHSPQAGDQLFRSWIAALEGYSNVSIT